MDIASVVAVTWHCWAGGVVIHALSALLLLGSLTTALVIVGVNVETLLPPWPWPLRSLVG